MAKRFGSILLTKYNNILDDIQSGFRKLIPLKANKSDNGSEEILMNQMITKANTNSNVGPREKFDGVTKRRRQLRNKPIKIMNRIQTKIMSSLQALGKTNVSSTNKSTVSRGNGETKKPSYNIDKWQSMPLSDILPCKLRVEMELSQL